MLEQWAVLPSDFQFDVWLHEQARSHISAVPFPKNFTLHWISSRLFPDTANFRRLLYSNFLALRKRSAVIFNPSQLEMTFVGAKQIVTVQDLIPIQVPNHHQKKQEFFHRFLVPRGLASAAAIIAPSRATQMALLAHYGIPAERVTIIPHGVRLRHPNGGSKPNTARRYLLFAGRIVPYRNVDTLIRAFLRIQHRVEHNLVLAGEISCDLNIPESNGRIIVRGYVGDDELSALYRGASAFAFPSSAEGFGFPPLEAMSVGCPVVTSAEASLPEVCQNAALFVNPGSEESIAEALVEVLSNEETRARLIREGLRRAAELTWEKSASAHLQLFERVLRGTQK